MMRGPAKDLSSLGVRGPEGSWQAGAPPRGHKVGYPSVARCLALMPLRWWAPPEQLERECRGGGPGVGSLGELALATGAGDPGTLSTFCAAAAPRPVELFAWLGRGRRCSRRMESPPARPR